MQIPQELVEQIEKGNVVLFLGAGVSMSAGLPGGEELAQELAERAELGDVSGRSLTEVAQARSDGVPRCVGRSTGAGLPWS